MYVEIRHQTRHVAPGLDRNGAIPLGVQDEGRKPDRGEDVADIDLDVEALQGRGG